MNRHLGDDQMIERLYGLEGDGAEHLSGCEECAQRFATLKTRRADEAEPQMDSAALAEQRAKILARLEQDSRAGFRWAPGFAAACLLLAVALVYRPFRSSDPAPGKQEAPSATIDEQLLADIYALEQAEEPRAASPIRRLFEEGLSEEQQ